jgi:Kef-type K+ transport system membrane component KefB
MLFIQIVIQTGIFFFFFLIGLQEIDILSIFSVLRMRVFAGATVRFVVPFALAVPRSTDLGPTAPLAVASVISISSLGVVAKILIDYGKLKEPLGLEIFRFTAVPEFIGLVVASAFILLANPSSFQETVNAFVAPFAPGLNATPAISGLPTATTVTALVPGQKDLSLTFEQLSFAWLFVCMVIFFSAVTLFRLKVLPHVMRYLRSHFKVREIYFGMFIGLILLMSYFAEASGVHPAVRALLLGLFFFPDAKEGL